MKLSHEIFDFLGKYAKTAANYDPSYDEPEDSFNGPDSSMFYAAAVALEDGRVPCVVISSWGSGCYKMEDPQGFRIHEELIAKLNHTRKQLM